MFVNPKSITIALLVGALILFLSWLYSLALDNVAWSIYALGVFTGVALMSFGWLISIIQTALSEKYRRQQFIDNANENSHIMQQQFREMSQQAAAQRQMNAAQLQLMKTMQQQNNLMLPPGNGQDDFLSGFITDESIFDDLN